MLKWSKCVEAGRRARGRIREWLTDAYFWMAERANEGSYGRLLFDGGAAVSLSSALAATLNITTGVVGHSVLEGTFNGADGVALLAAILLLPTGITTIVGVKMLLTGLKLSLNIKDLERGRREGREEGRQEERQLAIRADLLRRDNESIADAMERLREK